MSEDGKAGKLRKLIKSFALAQLHINTMVALNKRLAAGIPPAHAAALGKAEFDQRYNAIRGARPAGTAEELAALLERLKQRREDAGHNRRCVLTRYRITKA